MSEKVNELKNENIEESKNRSVREKMSILSRLEGQSEKLLESIKETTSKTMDAVGPIFDSVVQNSVEAFDSAKDNLKKVSKTAGESFNTVKEEGFTKSKLRKTSYKIFEQELEIYNNKVELTDFEVDKLYSNRIDAITLIKEVETKINLLANTPKSFDASLKEIDLELNIFEGKQEKINEAIQEIKVIEAGSGIVGTASALGVAVATLGPTAAMQVATTFGVASTGTAISSLSGAAASSATLAWLGGGAVTAGGGGVAAGTTFLALAGPVGWAIAGISLSTSVGLGFMASKKNAKQAGEILEEIEVIKEMSVKTDLLLEKVGDLLTSTLKQIGIVEYSNDLVQGTDYNQFSVEEKYQIGHLVNSTLSLTKLLNEEVSLNE